MPILSLNGITNLGNAHALSLQLINATGTGWDDVKTLIAAAGGGGSGTVTSATSPLTITNGVLSVDLSSKQNALVAGASISISGNTISFDGTLYFTAAQIAVLFAAYSSTIQMNTAIATALTPYSTTGQVTTLLNAKQATLTTPGAGVFLSGTTLSGYGLRWHDTNTPSAAIEELHFKGGLTVAQTVNLATSKLELTVSALDMATVAGVKALIANGITVSNGISKVSSASLGTVALSLNQTFQHSSLSFTGSTDTLRNVTTNGINSLWYGSNQIPLKVEQTLQTGLLANTTFKQQQLTIDSSYSSYNQAKLNMKYVGYSIAHMLVAEPGNFYMYASNPASGVAWLTTGGWALQTNPGGVNVTCGGTFTQSSDARLKEEIKDADLDMCQTVFDAISPKTYKRNDYDQSKSRIGFIAQDFEANLPAEFQNIVNPFTHGTGEDKQEMLGLDYGRLTCILWGVCKKQQQQIADLIAKVNA